MLAHTGVCGLATNWVLYSHLAVDIFIVLSGFCLILPVVRAGGLPGTVLTFYLRRARRILPPFYAALAFSLLATLLLQHCNYQAIGLAPRAVLINAALLQDVYLDQNIFNGPFWSIAVEWRIYFLFPLVVWSLVRFGCLSTLAWTAALGYALTGAIVHWQPQMYLACPWYLFLFAMGASAGWVAFAPSDLTRPCRIKWGWPSALFGAALAFVLHLFPVTASPNPPFGAYMPLIDAIGGAAVASCLIVLAQARSDASRKARAILGSRLCAGLGTFAYSLYLVHMPCVRLLSRLLSVWSITPITRVLLLAGIGVPLIIGFAYLFFLVCERPFLNLQSTKVR